MLQTLRLPPHAAKPETDRARMSVSIRRSLAVDVERTAAGARLESGCYA